MKCPHCNDNGHVLLMMSREICDRCHGTGQASAPAPTQIDEVWQTQIDEAQTQIDEAMRARLNRQLSIGYARYSMPLAPNPFRGVSGSAGISGPLTERQKIQDAVRDAIQASSAIGHGTGRTERQKVQDAVRDAIHDVAWAIPGVTGCSVERRWGDSSAYIARVQGGDQAEVEQAIAKAFLKTVCVTWSAE